jgi:hypothetical protein
MKTNVLFLLALTLGGFSAHAQNLVPVRQPEAILAELAPDWLFSDGLEFALPSVLLRTSSLKIRDPHFFAPVLPPFVCPDFTDTDIAGQANSSINNQINVSLTTDSDMDGFLDSSPLWFFQNALSGPLIRRIDNAAGQCTAPLGTSTCALPTATVADTYSSVSNGTDTCFSAIASTTGGYTPAVASVPAPCWLGSAKPSANLNFNGVSVPLFGVRTGGAASALDGPNGRVMMRGFLRETDANAILLPATLPLVGGRPLSVLLKGGAGSCAVGSDKDMLDGVAGWWFYMEQTIGVIAITP